MYSWYSFYSVGNKTDLMSYINREAQSIGIYDESDPLREVVTWGPVGVEAVLAQLYPPEVSLFYDFMDVIKAREEAIDYSALLSAKGVKVTQARDRLSELLPVEKLDYEEVVSKLINRAKQIQSRYKRIPLDHSETISKLVDQDIKRYGLNEALTMNKHLCLDSELPLGNVIFARDQMNVLLDTRFVSTMKKPIRQPEVKLYEMIYDKILGVHSKIKIPSNETFEGGDAYIHDGIVYVGVGPRTSRNAAIHIYQALEGQLNDLGYKFAIVEDINAHTRPQEQQMDFMHLDTFANPIGPNEIALCLEGAMQREVRFISRNNGQLKIEETGRNFVDYSYDHENHVAVVPKDEQGEFGCNFLAINSDTIIVPLSRNAVTIGNLMNRGKEVIVSNLDEITRGYGAAHCITGQLIRYS